MAGLNLDVNRPKTPSNGYRPMAKPGRSTGLDHKVLKPDLQIGLVSSTNKSPPPTALLVKHMNPSLTYIDSVNKYIPKPKPIMYDSSRPKSRVAMSRRSKPIAGQRHRPIVPIRPRCNSTSTGIDLVGFGEQFSSTTIVSGASQGEPEPTIIHGPLIEYKSPTKTHSINQYLGSQDMWNANSLSQTNEIMVDTLEVPVQAMLSENNEIQTIHIGDYSNIGTPNNSSPATEETFIASTDSSGECVVTVQQPTFKKAQGNCFSRPMKPSKAYKVITSTPMVDPLAEERCRSKNVKIRVVGYGRSRMIADYRTNIPVAEYKAQLNDTSDIISKLEIAPPTKRLMQLQNKNNNRTFKTEGASQLLTNSGRPMCSCLKGYFVRHLTTKPVLTEETFPDMELLPLGYTRTVDLNKIKRITRKRFYPEAEEYRRKLANEQLQLRFEHFVTDNEDMQTEFLQEEEEILPDYHATDPIFVEESLTNFDKEVHEEAMCLYGESAVAGSESTLGEDQHTLPDGNRSTIIMVHEEEHSDDAAAYTPKNIEVLLAAAEKQGVSRKHIQKVIFCQAGSREEQHLDPLGDELSNSRPTSST